MSAQYFNIGPYRFMFGPSVRHGETIHAPNIATNALWMWNGHYWQIEIADATDLKGAKHSMQFKIAERKAELARIAKAGQMCNASTLASRP